jgi:xanthine dehydrogenase accessory factor
VARVAREAGFVVTAVEDRPDQAARAEVDEVVIAEDLVEGLAGLETNAQDFIVVLTRSHGMDFRCARAALASPARYVGMLASKKKAARLRAELEPAQAARLESPVGLEIGAASAGEIAVSIVARMIQVKRAGREGG